LLIFVGENLGKSLASLAIAGKLEERIPKPHHFDTILLSI
jgi:hypothetical protein